MSVLEQRVADSWSKLIDLPRGFFLFFHAGDLGAGYGNLFLCYRGPGFRGITQLGGKKPSEEDKEAFICSTHVDGAYSEDLTTERKRVIAFFDEEKKKVLEEVQA